MWAVAHSPRCEPGASKSTSFTVSGFTFRKISAGVSLRTKEAGGRVVAVGTTTVRALESAARDGELRSLDGETTLFIYPGFSFRVVDALITNFHLPESSLLMLVCAFAGREHVLGAYGHAVEQGYRFFSYGDAMLVTP